jgi:hypothetical protein
VGHASIYFPNLYFDQMYEQLFSHSIFCTNNCVNNGSFVKLIHSAVQMQMESVLPTLCKFDLYSVGESDFCCQCIMHCLCWSSIYYFSSTTLSVFLGKLDFDLKVDMRDFLNTSNGVKAESFKNVLDSEPPTPLGGRTVKTNIAY